VRTSLSTRLFGPAGERTRIGSADIEWAVWSSGIDEIHEHDNEGRQLDLGAALELANSLNAISAELRLRNGADANSPVMHAVVLRWGYAWTAETEHSHGLDCGVPSCGPCSGPGRDMHRQPQS